MSDEPRVEGGLRKGVADALKRAGADRPCSRCGRSKFVIMDEPSTFRLQTNLIVPIVLVVCANCGYVAPHAIGIVFPGTTGTEE